MPDRITEILTKHRDEWNEAIEMMRTAKLTMRENGRDVTEAWTTYLIGKIAEIDEVLEKHERRNA